MSEKLKTEAARRRVFAIISHPDAGKTTLTENMLYAAGAIHQAGQVAARGQARRTQSDWMKIEQERGISVSSSVMTFEHKDLIFNLLDTPGHEDFSEDTYRTLTAADCAVMVLDAAKGIEPQTLKLFEVCRLRDIPIVTFVNKLDREARDTFDILSEIEDKLALDVVPMQWPAASGKRFRGVAELGSDQFLRFEAGNKEDASERTAVDGNAIGAMFDDDDLLEEFREEVELAKEYPDFNEQSFREGHMTPVYFGSALRKFGVRELIDALALYAPEPQPEKAERAGQAVEIAPSDPKVAGFVFKVQANMDLNHRDRVAFLRVCSGEFKRGMKLKTASGKSLTVHNPILFFAQDRELAEEAYAGDVIGIPNHGVLRVGDSLSETGKVRFAGIPNFAPEILRRAQLKDPLKAKHLRKALESLAEEGVTQLFKPALGADMIVGAVGSLQIDVMKERIKAEYGLDVTFEPVMYSTARWVAGDDDKQLDEFVTKNTANMAEDLDGAPVYLAKSAWDVGYAQEKNPDLRFLATRERNI
jgi:peptide chain release factor 3